YRKITKSRSNVLYELEGKSALALYKQYLGELASGLPGTALLFPLSIKLEENSEPVVRTILSVNEEDQSMTFAGDMPEGAQARLMKANFDRLIDAASEAATSSYTPFANHKPELALLISCVGRKLVLDQRVDEEVESVRNILGPEAFLTGFYSYGEISPLKESTKCSLHNQTMTITTFSEV
ncbi:MAG: FIST signal transduction protein, partial [Legionellales bacterium]